MKKEDKVNRQKDNERLSRRNFLKKSAYSAPVLVALGELVKPKVVHADSTGGPFGPPSDWLPWS